MVRQVQFLGGKPMAAVVVSLQKSLADADSPHFPF